MRPNFLRQIRHPFKGSIAYEWQIGPLVFLRYHDTPTIEHRKSKGKRFPKFDVWHDPYWRR
jgi:hypothetical protein